MSCIVPKYVSGLQCRLQHVMSTNVCNKLTFAGNVQRVPAHRFCRVPIAFFTLRLDKPLDCHFKITAGCPKSHELSREKKFKILAKKLLQLTD